MSSDSVRLFVSGDFCPSLQGAKILADAKPEEVWGNLCKEIASADLAITNLECPLTRSEDRISKIGPHLRNVPEVADFLRRSNLRFVTLANNHIYDYGQHGLEDTHEALSKNEIESTGAGINLEEARRTFYKQIKGCTLAIVNFSETEFNVATRDHGGANPMDLIDSSRQIREASHAADIVIVIIHGGHEHFHYPSPEMVKRYRFLAEQGAHVIIGHHTHCIAPYEIHQGIPIFYGLGNFLFDWENRPHHWYEGYALQLTCFCNTGIRFQILPYHQCVHGEMKTVLQEENSRLAKDIQRLCRDMSLPDMVEKKWEEFVYAQRFSVLQYTSVYSRSVQRIFQKLGISKFFLNKERARKLWHLLSCEAHREKGVSALSYWLKQAGGHY